MKRCREIITSHWVDGNKTKPTGHMSYNNNRLGKETRISIMLLNTVKRYVLSVIPNYHCSRLQDERIRKWQRQNDVKVTAV